MRWGRLIVLYSLAIGLLFLHPLFDDDSSADFLRNTFSGTCAVGLGLIAVNGFVKATRAKEIAWQEQKRHAAANRTLGHAFWMWESGCVSNPHALSRKISLFNPIHKVVKFVARTLNGLSKQEVNKIRQKSRSLAIEAKQQVQARSDKELEAYIIYIVKALGAFLILRVRHLYSSGVI